MEAIREKENRMTDILRNHQRHKHFPFLDEVWRFIEYCDSSYGARIWPPRKRAEYGFGEHGFKHRAQWVFVALTEFRGESSASSSQPIICVTKRTHRVVFFAELTEFAAELSEAQWVLFSETVLAEQCSARFLPPVVFLNLFLANSWKFSALPRFSEWLQWFCRQPMGSQSGGECSHKRAMYFASMPLGSSETIFRI